MKIKDKMSIHNRFDIEVIDAKSGKVKTKARAFNIILNRFWSTLGEYASNKAQFSHCFYGSGTGTPAATDSTLFNHVAAVAFPAENTGNLIYNFDRINGVISCQRSIQLDEQTSVGVEITEVGVGYGTSADNLCTHAMLEDMNGNPISIEKTDTDIINIYATIFIHHSQIGRIFLEDNYSSGLYVSASMLRQIMGTYKYGTESGYWACFADFKFSKESGPNNGGQAFILRNNGSYTDWVYSYSNKKISMKMKRLAVDEVNIGGIGSVWVSASGYQNNDNSSNLVFFVEDFYEGDDIVGEAVGTGDGTTKRFRTKFDFPEQAKVYVNGVLKSSGVTVRKTPANRYGKSLMYIQGLLKESTDAHNLVSSQATYHSGSTTWTNDSKVPLNNNIYMRNKSNVGFKSVKINLIAGSFPIRVYGSNDLSAWNQIAELNNYNAVSLDSTTGYYKYYKVEGGNAGGGIVEFEWDDEDWNNIVFDTAPAQGDVITIDYHTPYIAKDSDHVFDFTYEIQLGEYTE